MPSNSPYSADLLNQLLRSDSRKAFELFYRMEFDNVVHFIRSYLHDSEKALDLAQETFCAVWENRKSVHPEANFRSYVFTTARNRTLNSLKSRKLWGGANMPQTLDQDIALLEDPSVESLINALDLQHLIDASYASMPAKARVYFNLSRKAGLKNREIAAVKGVSEKTVEYHIRNALNFFRKNLGKEEAPSELL